MSATPSEALTEDIKPSLWQRIRKTSGPAGYLLYFYDAETMNAQILPLAQLKSVVRIRATQETFNLEEPAIVLDGVPVFFVLRGHHASIRVEFDDERIVERGRSAADIDAKIHSTIVQRIFRSSGFDARIGMITALVGAMSALVTYIILWNVHLTEMAALRAELTPVEEEVIVLP